MRIERVKAKAFGPFRDASLELAPGMTVVYGPNESGKSSWCAAIYAALCGLRRKHGRGTNEEVEFANRHKPWHGRAWSVSADIRLDDGRELELEQSLGSGGSSSAIDRKTKLTLSNRLMNDGAVDASTLLGLDRDAVPALLFVRQADILRVLDEKRAPGLQQYLQRAAASVAVDSTAEEALQRIEEFRRQNIGLVRVGSRGPMALATAALEQARLATGSRYDAYESYGACLAKRRQTEIQLETLGGALDALKKHEELRDRVEKWRAFRYIENRLRRARGLLAEVQSGPRGEAPSRELVKAVGGALAAHESRPPAPRQLEGPSAASLEEELASLPPMPSGDTRPDEGVAKAHERWRSACELLSATSKTEPDLGSVPELRVSASEVRRLADELERDIPRVDEALRDEVARSQARVDATRESLRRAKEPRARSAAPGFMLVGGIIAVLAGVVSALVAQFLVAGVLAVVGVVLVVLGLRRPGPEQEEGARATEAELDAQVDALAKLKARLDLQVETAAGAEGTRQSTRARLHELGLPGEPAPLRELAAKSEVRAQIAEKHDQWKRLCAELQAEVTEAAGVLRRALELRSAKVDPSRLEESVRSYLEECAGRATQREKASRRPDLEARLQERRAAERAFSADQASRRQAEEQLRQVASEVGCNADDLDDVVARLLSWMTREEEQSALRKKRDENRARLDQVLEGHSIEELEEAIERMRSELPDEPEGGADVQLEDRTEELTRLDAESTSLRNQIERLNGELVNLEKGLGNLAEAIEHEAHASSEHERLGSLGKALEHAAELLTAAKEKAHANIAPVIDKMLLPWIRKVTGGRYDDVRVHPETLALEVHESGATFRNAQFLSHGTTEQMFLLLRVALSKLLVSTDETAPLILDDVFVQSDTTRTRALLDLLHDLSRERQIILFSQEEEVLTWAQRELDTGKDRLVTLG